MEQAFACQGSVCHNPPGIQIFYFLDYQSLMHMVATDDLGGLFTTTTTSARPFLPLWFTKHTSSGREAFNLTSNRIGLSPISSVAFVSLRQSMLFCMDSHYKW